MFNGSPITQDAAKGKFILLLHVLLLLSMAQIVFLNGYDGHLQCLDGRFRHPHMSI